MTRDDIAAVMEKLPLLNAFGIGIAPDRKMTDVERKKALEDARAMLLASEEQCTRACEWLSKMKHHKAMTPGHSSYSLKAIAERDIGYITNGAFIAAAIHCGFDYRLISGSPNVRLAINPVSLKSKR